MDFTQGNVLLFDNEKHVRELIANYKENELEEQKDILENSVLEEPDTNQDTQQETNQDEEDATKLIIPEEKKSKIQVNPFL